MPEPILPITPSADATELETLRRTNADLLQKSATRKARIAELETSVGSLTTRATESDARIKALTIDGPLNDVFEQISVAPQALRTSFEADYRVELNKDGALTLLNASDGLPIMHEGKTVPVQADAIRNLLLATKDGAKIKLYRAIVVASKASGASGGPSKSTASAPAKGPQFGLGMSVKS